MAWVAPVVGGVASLASSVISGQKAKKAKKAANSVERLRLGMARDLQTRYLQKFAPLQDRAIELATRGVDPDAEAGAAGADVQRSLATANGQLLRDFGRRGINPNDPAAIDALARTNLTAGLGRASAMTMARRGARDTQLNNLLQVSNIGAPLLGQASATLSQIGSDRNARSMQADQLAGQAAAGAGESIADLLSYFATRGGGNGGGLNATQTVYPGQRVA